MTRHSLRAIFALSSLAAGLLAAGSASAKEVTLDLGHASVKVGWEAPTPMPDPLPEEPLPVPPQPEHPILLERHPVSHGGISAGQFWSGDDLSVSASGAAVTLSLDPGFGISAFTSNQYNQSSRHYFIDFLANATVPFAFVADEGYVIDGYRVSLQTSYHDTTQFMTEGWMTYEGSLSVHGTSGAAQALSLDAQNQAYGYEEGVASDLLTIEGHFSTDGELYPEHTFPYWMDAYSKGFEISAIKIEVLTSPLAAPVPEPQTWALLAAGLGLTVAAARRRRG